MLLERGKSEGELVNKGGLKPQALYYAEIKLKL